MEFHRIVNKGALPYFYMKIGIEFDDGEPGLNVVVFRMVILAATKQLFGEAGIATIHFDILQYNEETCEAIVRVKHRDSVKFWSALTLYGSYNDRPCAFRVHQVSNHLLGLAANSRVYQHIPIQTHC